jgi:hypothetical protein
MCGLPPIDPAAATTAASIDPAAAATAASIDPPSGSVNPASTIDPAAPTDYSSSIYPPCRHTRRNKNSSSDSRHRHRTRPLSETPQEQSSIYQFIVLRLRLSLT